MTPLYSVGDGDLVPLPVVPLAQALLSACCLRPPARGGSFIMKTTQKAAGPCISVTRCSAHTAAPFPHSQPHPPAGLLLQGLQASLEYKTAIAGCSWISWGVQDGGHELPRSKRLFPWGRSRNYSRIQVRDSLSLRLLQLGRLGSPLSSWDTGLS